MPVLLYDALAGGARSGSMLNADPSLLDQYESVFRSLNNANIAVYGVDIKGVHQRLHERDPHDVASAVYGPRGTVDPRDSNEDDGIKALSIATRRHVRAPRPRSSRPVSPRRWKTAAAPTCSASMC